LIWIDEAEMQLGDRLSDRLISEIGQSQYLLVLLAERN
jgi:hypothetical protein